MKKKPIYAFKSILKKEFINFREMRQSQGIKDSHIYVLEMLDSHLVKINHDKKEITSIIIDAWLPEVSTGLATSAVANFIAIYSRFAQYLGNLRISAFVPEYPRPDSSYIPYIFTEREIKNIFSAADNMKVWEGTDRNSVSKYQIPMLLRLLYGCGLRVGEAFSLRLSDFDASSKVIRITKAKGNKERWVPLDETLSTILEKYCKMLFPERGDDPYLFASDVEGKPRTHGWLSWYFPRILENAGIVKLHLPPRRRNICHHCLRHTFAVHSLRQQTLAGIDNYDPTPLISLYLGHHDLSETAGYLHMSAETSVDIIEQTNECSKGLFPGVPK